MLDQKKNNLEISLRYVSLNKKSWMSFKNSMRTIIREQKCLSETFIKKQKIRLKNLRALA